MKKVTVELIIDEDDEGRIADGVSAILTEQMQSICPNSCLVDWQYAGGKYNAEEVTERTDFREKKDFRNGPIC
jgi:hypothetical protein